jgi:hypothetical protein
MTRSRDVADTQDNSGGAVAPYVGAKNFALNGSFDIWQRGTSGILGGTGTTYTADRWATYAAPDGTISRQVTGDTTNLPFIQYCARIQRNSGQTTTGTVGAFQSLESINSIPFVGKTITISYYARKGANFSAASDLLNGYIISGTGTDQNLASTGFTGQTTVATSAATLTTTWQRFTATGTVATNATQVGLRFSYVSTGTAGANDYFEVTGVQVELGAQMTPFARSGGSIGGELALCQRYYEKSFNTDTTPANGANSSSLATNVGANYTYTSGATGNESATIYMKVVKRAAPTITFYGNNSGQWLTPSGGVSASTERAIGTNNFSMYQTLTGSYATTYGHWTASAEL